jgi:hypothetical protein
LPLVKATCPGIVAKDPQTSGRKSFVQPLMRRIEKSGCYPRPPVAGVDVEPVELSLNAEHNAIRIDLVVQTLATNVRKSNDPAVHIWDQHFMIRIPPVRQIATQHPMPTIVSSRAERRVVEELIRHQSSVGQLPRGNVCGGNVRSVARPSRPDRQSHLPILDEEAPHTRGYYRRGPTTDSLSTMLTGRPPFSSVATSIGLTITRVTRARSAAIMAMRQPSARSRTTRPNVS